jgi:hypothetical protein
MSEWIYGDDPSSPLGRAEAEFFRAPRRAVSRAA